METGYVSLRYVTIQTRTRMNLSRTKTSLIIEMPKFQCDILEYTVACWHAPGR